MNSTASSDSGEATADGLAALDKLLEHRSRLGPASSCRTRTGCRSRVLKRSSKRPTATSAPTFASWKIRDTSMSTSSSKTVGP